VQALRTSSKVQLKDDELEARDELDASLLLRQHALHSHWLAGDASGRNTE
jgi:hypothetical protein